MSPKVQDKSCDKEAHPLNYTSLAVIGAGIANISRTFVLAFPVSCLFLVSPTWFLRRARLPR